MRSCQKSTSLLAAILFGSLAGAAPARVGELVPRTTNCNTATDRACWTDGFDINTDWEVDTPTTGNTREYTFTITEVDNYVGADGVAKVKAMLINNQFPGPTIVADWGDTVRVTVINNLQTNGTGIHWHGVRLLNNNINDGVPGVTECPIPPGHNKTYTFNVTQYGTSWYHTHVSSQYVNGIVGSLQFNGPASLPYDIDLGPFPITDWYYGAADQILASVSDASNPNGPPGASPPSDNVFFNGTNINPAGEGGNYAKVALTPGLRHRLRFINPSVDNTFTVSIVNHEMTVIATDFVPVDAFTTSSIFMGIGQRYDVTIDASAAVGNYWINVTFSGTRACGQSKNPFPAAILHYDGASDDLPTDAGTPPPDSFCADSLEYVPIVTRSAPLADFKPDPSDTLPVLLEVDAAISRVFWKVNGTAINVTWDQPTLQLVQEGTTSDFPQSENIVQIPGTSEWSFWLIQNESPVPHPMHLHGHDFLILGQSPAPPNPFDPASGPVTFNPDTDMALLKSDNPVRRDATMLPSFGWLVVAFQVNNPGSWLFHCHIAWHVSQGLSAQFLEKVEDIPSSMDLNNLSDNCKNWKEYFPTDPYTQVDSGI